MSATTVGFEVSDEDGVGASLTSGGMWTIPRGSVRSTHSVVVSLSAGDSVRNSVDGVRHFELRSRSASGTGANPPPTVRISVLDDELPLHVRIVDSAVSESAGSTGLSVEFSNSDGSSSVSVTNFAPVVVSWTAIGVTAVEGDDYMGLSGSVTIPTGSSSVAIPSSALSVIDDMLYDGSVSETFEVELSLSSASSSGALLATDSGSRSATVTIVDDESSPTASFALASSSVAESVSGGTSVDVGLSVGSDEDVDVVWSVIGVGSPRGSRTLTIPPKSTSGSIGFSKRDLDDEIFTGDRVWTLTIARPSGGSRTSHALTLEDEDSDKASVTFSSASRRVSVEEGVSATLDVELSRVLESDETSSDVSFAVSGGTATSGNDYTLPDPLTVSFPNDGSTTTRTITIPTVNDDVYEFDETLIVTLSSATGSAKVSGTQSSTLTITSEDSSPTASFASPPPSASEGDGARIGVELSRASSSSTDVVWTVTGTGAAPLDESARTLTIAAGVTTGEIVLSSAYTDDAIFTGDRLWTLAITSPSGDSETSHELSLTDEESDKATVTIASSRSSVTEGDVSPLAFDVTLSRALESGETSSDVVYSLSGTATSGDDYTPPNPLSVRFPTNGRATTRTISIPTLEDSGAEGDETVIVTLLSADGSASVASSGIVATGTIVDDDAATLRLASGDRSVAETDAVQTKDYVFSVSGTRSSDSVVTFSVVDDDADTGQSATISSGGSWRIPSGSSAVENHTVVVSYPGDRVRNAVSSRVVRLSGSSSVTSSVASPSATEITLSDNESVLHVRLSSDVTVSESSGGTGLAIEFSDSSGLSAVDVTNHEDVVVTWTAGGASATATSADYSSSGGVATISAGMKSVLIPSSVLSVVDDSLFDDGDETFVVTLSSADSGILISSSSSATVTIEDDETTPSLSVELLDSSGSVLSSGLVSEEGGPYGVRAVLSTAMDRVVSVTLSVGVSSTASAGDYSLSPLVLTIASGSTESSLSSLTMVDDSVADGGETIVLSASATSATSGSATVTITDAESASLAVVSATTPVEEEDAVRTADYIFAVSGNRSSDAVVTFSVVDDDADSGQAATISSGGTWRIPSGSSSVENHTVVISYPGDNVRNAVSSRVVTLSGVSSVTDSVASPSSTEITVTDDESALFVGFASSGVSVNESDADAATGLVVRLSESSGAVVSDSRTNYADVDVTWTASDVTAEQGSGKDYEGTTGTATISAGSLSFVLPMSSLKVLSDDLHDGGDETFSVLLSSPTSGVSLSSVSSATVTIVDDESSPPTASFGVGLVDEATEGSTISVPFALSVASDSDVVISWSRQRSGDDLERLSHSVSSGLRVGSASWVLSDDSLYLGDFDWTLTIESVGGRDVSSPKPSHSLTVKDQVSDKSSVTSFSAVESSVEESAAGSDAEFEVRLDRVVGAGETATIGFSLSGTAESSSDYIDPDPMTVTIAAGSDKATLRVRVNDDGVHEQDETLTATLTAIASSDSGSSVIVGSGLTADVTIEDDDSAPTSSFVSASSSVSEGLVGGARIGFRLSRASSTPTDVVWQVSGFGAPTLRKSARSLSVLAGDTTGEISFTADQLDDEIFTGDRTWTLSFVSASSGVLSHALTLTDESSDKATVTISSPSEVDEGDSGVFTVSLSRGLTEGESSSSVSFEVLASETTAQSDDYSVTTLSPLTFPTDGTTSLSIAFTTSDDSVSESDETITIGLTSASGSASLSSVSSALKSRVAIDDDDAAFQLESGLRSFFETDATRSLAYVIEVSGNRPSSSTATFVVSDSSAPSGLGVTISSGSSWEIPSGSSDATHTVTLSVPGDNVRNSRPVRTLTLSANTSPSFSVNLEVKDDEEEMFLRIEDVTIGEGSSTLPEVSFSKADGSDLDDSTQTFHSAVVAPWSTSPSAGPTGDSSATSGEDYVAVSSGSSTIDLGGVSASLTDLRVLDDSLFDGGDETFVIRLNASPSSIALSSSSSATVTIEDDESSPTASFASSSSSVVEGSSATVPLTLSVASDSPTSVTWTASGDGSPSGSRTLSVAAKSTSGLISVTPPDDGIHLDDRSWTLTITSPSGGSRTSHALTITDDDSAATATLSAGSATVAEGLSASFDVSLDRALSVGESSLVSYSLSGVSGSDDYDVPSGSVSFASGDRTKTITISVTDDSVREPSETLIVTLDGATGSVELGSTLSATTTITDGDKSLFVGIADVSVSEGVSGGLTGLEVFFAESDGSTRITDTTNYADVVVSWTASDGTATEGSDYDDVGESGGSVTISAGSSSVAISASELRILDDSVYEGSTDETFDVTISLATASGVSLPSDVLKRTATVTIEDDDTSASASLSPSSLRVSEGSTATFTVSLSRALESGETASVAFSVSEGTASSVDYGSPSPLSPISFSSGEMSKTITIAATDDGVFESDETFSVTLDSASGVAVLGSATTSAVTIVEDDSPPTASLSLSSSPLTLSEGSTSSGAAMVTLSSPTSEPVTMTLDSDVESLISDFDVTIPSGGSPLSVDLTALDDSIYVGDRTVTLTLKAKSSNATVDSSSDEISVVVSDEDSDKATVSGLALSSSARISESASNASADFVVSLRSFVGIG